MNPFKDFNNLYFFAKVADFGSYTGAAEALGLQTSKLSRRIGALERELGVRLLNSTTRKLSLTETGKTFPFGPSRMILVSCPVLVAALGQSRSLADIERMPRPLIQHRRS